jgi:hypothetical protein
MMWLKLGGQAASDCIRFISAGTERVSLRRVSLAMQGGVK